MRAEVEPPEDRAPPPPVRDVAARIAEPERPPAPAAPALESPVEAGPADPSALAPPPAAAVVLPVEEEEGEDEPPVARDPPPSDGSETPANADP